MVRFLRRRALFLALPLIVGACRVTTEEAAVSSCVGSKLEINAPNISMPASSGYTYTFSPSGGVPPYSFSVTTGTGTVDASGVYTAGRALGTDIVRITDRCSKSVSSSVLLVNSLVNGSINAQTVDVSGDLPGIFVPLPKLRISSQV